MLVIIILMIKYIIFVINGGIFVLEDYILMIKYNLYLL